MRNYVVTGCSRSGTSFIAKMFTDFGWRCGHEDVFQPTFAGFTEFGEYQGDASWLAVPYLDQLPDDVLLLHQVREPLATIRSMASRRFLTPALSARSLRKAGKRLRKLQSPRNRYRTFVLRHTPGVFLETSVFARAARHWMTWNRLVERHAETRPYLRYRLEDIDDELIKAVSDRLGVDPPAQMEIASDPMNVRMRLFDDHDFGKLRPALREEIKRMAERYGYEE